jgi:hypothetical protein
MAANVALIIILLRRSMIIRISPLHKAGQKPNEKKFKKKFVACYWLFLLMGAKTLKMGIEKVCIFPANVVLYYCTGKATVCMYLIHSTRK